MCYWACEYWPAGINVRISKRESRYTSVRYTQISINSKSVTPLCTRWLNPCFVKHTMQFIVPIYITGQNTYNLKWFEKRGLWVLNSIQFAMYIALHWISSLARAFQGVCIIDGKNGDWKIYMNIYITTQRLHAVRNCCQKFLSTWFGTIYIWYVCDFYIQYWRQCIYIYSCIHTHIPVYVIVTIIVIMMITSVAPFTNMV